MFESYERAQNDTLPTLVAHLDDRIAINENRFQKYGTQLKEVNGRLETQLIDDLDEVNANRAELGMESLGEYVEYMQKDINSNRSKNKG